MKQIEEKVCKRCLHKEMCLENFRRAKEEGLWELTTEEEYFSYANECDFFIAGYRKQSDVAREVFEEIEKEVASKIPMKIQPIFKDDRDFEGGFINGKTDALLDVLVLISKLKKKYTGGNNDYQ